MQKFLESELARYMSSMLPPCEAVSVRLSDSPGSSSAPMIMIVGEVTRDRVTMTTVETSGSLQDLCRMSPLEAFESLKVHVLKLVGVHLGTFTASELAEMRSLLRQALSECRECDSALDALSRELADV